MALVDLLDEYLKGNREALNKLINILIRINRETSLVNLLSGRVKMDAKEVKYIRFICGGALVCINYLLDEKAQRRVGYSKEQIIKKLRWYLGELDRLGVILYFL